MTYNASDKTVRFCIPEKFENVIINDIIYHPEQIDIFVAIKNRNLEQVLKFIKICQVLNKNIDIRQNNGSTPLHAACLSNFEEAAVELIEAGACIHATNNYLTPPFHYAIQIGSFLLVNYLIEKGADIDEANHNGKTPLHIACYYNQFEIFKALIDNGASTNCVQDNDGNIPLIYLIRHRNCELPFVQYIVENFNVDLTKPITVAQYHKKHILKYLENFQKMGRIVDTLCDQHHINVCKICWERQVIICFVPCGHLTCYQCCLKLESNACHHCRQPIQDKVRIYLN